MTPDRDPDHAPDDHDNGHDEDREAVDRAFAELVAGYHLTADRPEVPHASPPAPAPPEPDPAWADEHPLFRYSGPEQREPSEQEEREAERRAEGHYEAPPPAPLPRPAWPVLLGWLGMGYALLVVLAVVVGVSLPGWATWLALLGFVGGFGILVACLPRSRPPDDDGAVL